MSFKNHFDRNKNHKIQQGASASEDMFRKRRAKALMAIRRITMAWRIRIETIKRKHILNNRLYVNSEEFKQACKKEAKAKSAFFRVYEKTWRQQECKKCGSHIAKINKNKLFCCKCGAQRSEHG